MEDAQITKVRAGTHPLLTMLLFVLIAAGVITSGSYVSKQKSLQRELEVQTGMPITAFR